MKRKSVWKEQDPIAIVMAETGKTRLQVLEGVRDAMTSRHSPELARNPKAPKAMANLERMIKEARTTEHHERARLIEKKVQTEYLDEETDAADLALDELNRDDKRTDGDIAHVIAMRISYP